LPLQVVVAQNRHLVALIGVRERRDVGDQPGRGGVDLRQRHLAPLRLRLPLGGPVEGVDIVGIVLADGQHQLDVAFGNGVHRDGRSRLRADRDRGKERGSDAEAQHADDVTRTATD
jgi:hypothetical protein